MVWNIFYFPIYWESHHPNWLILVQTTNQYLYIDVYDILRASPIPSVALLRPAAPWRRCCGPWPRRLAPCGRRSGAFWRRARRGFGHGRLPTLDVWYQNPEIDIFWYICMFFSRDFGYFFFFVCACVCVCVFSWFLKRTRECFAVLGSFTWRFVYFWWSNG